ncbi:hypothetical protein StoSoilB13_10070 [Arthrobacter sp. StoSoilB13]|nr:hypothetical protein StoSoilB13_10070 [Arthrobacter sp. StoSoilB13]
METCRCVKLKVQAASSGSTARGRRGVVDAKEPPAAAAEMADKVKGDGLAGLPFILRALELDPPDLVVYQACAAPYRGPAFFHPPLAPLVPPDGFVDDDVVDSLPLDCLWPSRFRADDVHGLTEKPHIHTPCL